jgi:nitrite reductase/ring-hydroxylating ferredoxin subunit
VRVEFVPVVKVSELAPGSAATVVIDGREVAVFNSQGKYYALDNTCPHQGGPLAEGWIEGRTVTCPWHGWCFGLDDGKLTTRLGGLASVDVFDVRVEGDTISVARTPRRSAQQRS